VTVDGRSLIPGQANNAYIFPGLGLGIVLSRANRVSEQMFHVAARLVADSVATEELARGTLLPALERIRELSIQVAAAVVRVAVAEGLSSVAMPDDVAAWVRERVYQPVYPSYVRA
jgi:malate dehydrogenase (oxaloacetate-decarboxylating)(NADP+)